MLTEEAKRRIIQYRGLALGLFQSVSFSASCSEYDIRNGFSRLYYSFFHASLALLLSRHVNIETFRKNHGVVHTEIDKLLGKYVGRFFRELYLARIQSDYEPDVFAAKYHGQLDRARFDANSLLTRASAYFYWVQQESRKVLVGAKISYD
jgi:uncharacterized protein (UPF0332 family)